MQNNRNSIMFENVKLQSKNFSGEIKPMNDRGNRTCLVVLTVKHAKELGFDTVSEMVETLKADDWNIRQFKASENEPNREPDAYMPVKAVYYRTRRSNIWIKKPNGKGIPLTEDTVGDLDSYYIEYANVIINKHYYDSHGRQGYNNEIKSMEVFIEEDEIMARNRSCEDDYPDVIVPFN